MGSATENAPEEKNEPPAKGRRTFAPPTKQQKPADQKSPPEQKPGKSLGQWWSEDSEDDFE